MMRRVVVFFFLLMFHLDRMAFLRPISCKLKTITIRHVDEFVQKIIFFLKTNPEYGFSEQTKSIFTLKTVNVFFAKRSPKFNFTFG